MKKTRKNSLSPKQIKKVVVVNDCGYVWEDLKPYLPKNVQWQFIRRNRGLWDKTFGVFFKILFSHGDFYIANFALQDAWLVQKLKHLDLLICHGGDVRWTIKKQYWGWMVKSNLKNARHVAYTVDDIAESVRKYRSDAFFLHRPIQAEKYQPKKYNNHKQKCFRAVYFEKPYDEFNPELLQLLIDNNCTLTMINNSVPHEKMPEFLRNFDVLIDHMAYDGSVSKICLEAMSCGLCVITWKDREHLKERVTNLMNPQYRLKEAEQNRNFIEANHDANIIAITIQNQLIQ